jgi:hypothetical protein
MLVICVTACGKHASSIQTAPDAGSATDSLVYLTPTEHLTRASLALRGIRPSIADLTAVNADPTQLPGVIDQYLASPEFGETIKDLHNATLLLRVENPLLTLPANPPLANATFTQLNELFEEPLELIKYVVMQDHPYSEIVTAPYTMANDVAADVWGISHSPGSTTWDMGTYPDARGAAGILSTSILYHRWQSAGFNFNRGRANLVSRALLCHDFLDSDIAVDTSVDLSNPQAVATAVVSNPSCAGCHQTLDPLASYFFGFDGTHDFPTYPDSTSKRLFYDPSRLDLWMTTNDRPPMYFGDDTTTSLQQLGAAIAADPRFAQCAAMHFASYLSEVPQDQLPGDWVANLQAQFVASNLDAKALAKAVVLSDQFRVSYSTDPTAAASVVGYLKVRPEQLSRMLFDLTGFVWTTDSTQTAGTQPVGTVDLLRSDFIGFRALAGGIDSYFVTSPVLTMNATASLTAKLSSEAAAEFVVDHDAAAAQADRTLFLKADVTATDETSVRAELAFLHARLYGELVDPTDPSVDDSYTLFTQALSTAGGDSSHAWKVTLTGMLSDLRSQFY